MIITSSIGGLKPFPGALTYSAAKAFDDFMGRGLNIELGDTVDVLSFTPGGVTSNFLNTKAGLELREKRKGFYIDSDMAAEYCFRDLGHSDQTYGAFKHSFAFALRNSFLMNGKGTAKKTMDVTRDLYNRDQADKFQKVK